MLSKQWSRSVGDGQGDLYNLLEPAVDGSTIYAASAEGRVMAIQRETGDVLWKKDLERPVSGGVGVGYGLVLVGTLRGDVIALDEATGKRSGPSESTAKCCRRRPPMATWWWCRPGTTS